VRTWINVVLAVALAASVAMNVAQARHARAAVPVRSRPSNERPESVVVPSAPRDSPALSACHDRLAECEARNWDVVARAVAMGPSAVRASPVDRDDRDAGSGGTGPAAQAAALCNAAERSLREQWQRERETMVANLTRSLNDATEQDRNVEHEVASMAETAHLSDADGAALQTEYRARRLARVDEARAALGRAPPDLASLTGIARSLFADEDAALEHVGGPAARDAWRSRQLEGRSVILAITATLGDQDWGEALGW
jgi:hypothetical protein